MDQFVELLLLAGKVIDGDTVLPAFPPGPFFRDVVFILKPHDQSVFMPRRELWEITRTGELKYQFLHIGRLWYCSHARLIVGWAVVDQSDAIAIDRVKRQHFFHAMRRKRLHDRGIRYNDFEVRGCVFAGTLPVAVQGLQFHERGG